MRRKYYRIQPRVSQEQFKSFQQLAANKGMNISQLARRVIDDFIQSETSALKEKTPA
jgi:exoribonuclease R